MLRKISYIIGGDVNWYNFEKQFNKDPSISLKGLYIRIFTAVLFMKGKARKSLSDF